MCIEYWTYKHLASELELRFPKLLRYDLTADGIPHGIYIYLNGIFPKNED